MKEKLFALANKYKLDNIISKLDNLEKNSILRVGFLGEFSSGKSTLINGLLNQKVLPAMVKPTSKSIIEIYAKNNINETNYYEIRNDQKVVVSAMDFSDIALSSSDKKGLLEVPSNDFFQDGYMFVDTPGVSSLDKNDIDITYGYLPFLDCAIICNHIEKGSLTQSTINFLLKDEIKPIINNLLFVITNSHLKPVNARETIKKNIISQVYSINNEHNLNIEDIEDKVIVVSSLESMDNKEGFSLDELKNSLKKLFVNEKQELLNQRENKELIKIAYSLEDSLNYIEKNSNLNLDNLKQSEIESEDNIKLLKKEKRKIIEKVESIYLDIQRSLDDTLYNYLNKMKNIKSEEEIKNIVENMSQDISNQTNLIVQRNFKSINISQNSSILIDLENSLNDTFKKIDLGKNIGMVALIELLTIGTAGIGGALGFFLRNGVRTFVTQKGKGGEFAKIFAQINPIDLIGDKLGSSFIEKEMEQKIKEISAKISYTIKTEIEIAAENEMFAPIEEKLQTNQNILNQLYKDKSNKLADFFENTESLKNDIVEVKLLLKDCNV